MPKKAAKRKGNFKYPEHLREYYRRGKTHETLHMTMEIGLKRELEVLSDELGMSQSLLMRMALRYFLNTKRTEMLPETKLSSTKKVA